MAFPHISRIAQCGHEKAIDVVAYPYKTQCKLQTNSKVRKLYTDIQGLFNTRQHTLYELSKTCSQVWLHWTCSQLHATLHLTGDMWKRARCVYCEITSFFFFSVLRACKTAFINRSVGTARRHYENSWLVGWLVNALGCQSRGNDSTPRRDRLSGRTVFRLFRVTLVQTHQCRSLRTLKIPRPPFDERMPEASGMETHKQHIIVAE